MDRERWQQLEAIYEAAAELAPEEREGFVNERCGGDQELRRELMAMFDESGRGLSQAVGQAAAAVAKALDDWTGKRIGPYRVVRQIGEGGMGTVYEAVREDAFQKRVAIKLVKYSFDSDFARKRFQQERQILARLEHPNIARLLDGGDYEGRWPYLVMEYVEGEALLEATAKWDFRAKLRLFQRVLSAVAHAHRELIVHRDIKPSNILVSADGQPKLLDFGIARLNEETAPGDAPQTSTGAALMTPDYASPEQIMGQPAVVASDIYSLGATLYQLVSGARPHKLETYSPAEMYQVICEKEVLPPSEMAEDANVARELRGDVDTIVLHAMSKDAAARYSSAEAFSTEIQSYLDGRPLTVRPASSFERAWKFAKRNRLAVGAMVALILSLVGGITLSTIEARRAQRRFAQVRELANTFLFQFYDEVTPLSGSTKVRASIVETARKYLDGLAGEAGNDKGLMLELAEAYKRLGDIQTKLGPGNLGNLDEGRRSYNKSVELYRSVSVGPTSPSDLRRKLASTYFALARLEYNAQHEGIAEAPTIRGLELLPDVDQENPSRLVRAQLTDTLGEIRTVQGRSQEALRLLEAAQQEFLFLRSVGYSPSTMAFDIQGNGIKLARAKSFAGDLDGAEQDYLEVLKNTEPCDEQKFVRSVCRQYGVVLSWVGDVYAATNLPNLGQPAQAEGFYEKALHVQQLIVPTDPNDRQARFDLASRYGKLGDAIWKSDPKRAIQLYDQALATAKTLASTEQFKMFQDAYDGAVVRPMIRLGRYSEARKILTHLLEVAQSDTDYPDLVDDVQTQVSWSDLLIAEGKIEEAREYLENLIRHTQGLHASHPQDFMPVFELANEYRILASISFGQQRRDAYLHSAAIWHSWPATTFTQREEQKDLAATKAVN